VNKGMQMHLTIPHLIKTNYSYNSEYSLVFNSQFQSTNWGTNQIVIVAFLVVSNLKNRFNK